MRLLVLHQNFPGQFGPLVKAWSHRPGWDVRALGRDTAPGLPGFSALTSYKLARVPSAHQHPYLRTMESAELHDQAVARVLLDMKKRGFTPVTVLSHPGWGESLYVKDVFPDARPVYFCEWYYQAEGADLGFDPEFPITFDDRARIRTWNALHALNLRHCDAAVTPTYWQKSRHPEIFWPKVTVQHEGIDADNLGPDRNAWIKTPDGTLLKGGDPVVTYVARNLEPYRAFHVFMRALEKLQQQHKTVQALIVGGDDVSYGKRPKGAKYWREKMLREVKLDVTRTHFTGKLPQAQYVKVLQVSAAHVYLTYPFVLSWSLLEAMACGALVVASDTAPVRGVVRDGESGMLVPFFDPQAIATRVSQAVNIADERPRIVGHARQLAARYSNASALREYSKLMGAESLVPRNPHQTREKQNTC